MSSSALAIHMVGGGEPTFREGCGGPWFPWIPWPFDRCLQVSLPKAFPENARKIDRQHPIR